MSDIVSALAPEVLPPPPLEKKKRVKRLADAGQPRKKRGPPRPYRKIDDATLIKRTERLTKRIERVKKQHESTRTLLTKYVHEKFYRDKELLHEDGDMQLPSIDALPPVQQAAP